MNSPELPLLAELLLRASLVLAAAFLGALVLRRASAAAQAGLWLAAFAALAALIGAVATDRHPRFPVPASPGTPVVVTTTAEATATPGETAVTADSSAALPTPATLLTTAWLVGSAGIAAFLLLGLVQSQALRRGGRTPGLAVRSVADEFPHLRVRLTSSVAAPCLAGLLRPTVLLPMAAETWTVSRLRATLHHEAEHSRRRDPLARALALLVCAVLWPNPLVWIALHRLRTAQEQACDDAVLRAGTDAADYGEVLVLTARAFTGRPRLALSMARPSTLEERLRALVDPARDRRLPSQPTLILTMIVAVMGGLFASATAEPGEPSLSGATTAPRPPAVVVSAAIISAAPGSDFGRDLVNGQVLAAPTARVLEETLLKARDVDRLSTPTVHTIAHQPFEISVGGNDHELSLTATPTLVGSGVQLAPTVSLRSSGQEPRTTTAPARILQPGEMLVVRAEGNARLFALVRAEVDAPAAPKSLPKTTPTPNASLPTNVPASAAAVIGATVVPSGSQPSPSSSRTEVQVPSPAGGAPGTLSGEMVGLLENNGGWIATGFPTVLQGKSLIEGTAVDTAITVRPDGRVEVTGSSRNSVVP